MSTNIEENNYNKAEVKELVQLRNAIESGNSEDVKKILNSHKFQKNSINKQLSGAFNQYYNEPSLERKKVIILLLSQESVEIDFLFDNPQSKNEKITILILAAMKADIFLLKELINFNPNINFRDCYSKNALMYLLTNYVIKKDEDEKSLIELDKIPQKINSKINSIVKEEIAIKINTEISFNNKSYSQLYSCVEILLKNNILINSEDNNGNTALTIATGKEYIEICELLLTNGANINQQVSGNLNRTVVHMAVMQKNLQLIKLFIKFKPNLLLKNDNKKNPIDEAVENIPNSEIYGILAEESNKRSDNIINEDTKIKKDLNKALGNSNRHTPVSNKINNNFNLTQVDFSTRLIPKNISQSNLSLKINKSEVISEPNEIDEKFTKGYLYEKVNFLPKNDAKYAKIKEIINNSTISLPQQSKILEKVEKSNSQIIKKLETELSEIKKENSFLKIKLQMIADELKVKNLILVEAGLVSQANCFFTFGTSSNNNIGVFNTDNPTLNAENHKEKNIFPENSNKQFDLKEQVSIAKNQVPQLHSFNCHSNSFLSNSLGFPSFNQAYKNYDFYLNLANNVNLIKRKEMLEKKFNTTMYSNDYVLKSLHKDLLDFQEFNREQIIKIKPIQEELLGYIKEAVEETLPDYEVKLYGSHATGLCLSWSDLDTVLVHKKGISPQTYSPSLQSLYMKLYDKSWKKSIKYIETAVIPLIKIIASDKYGNMQIDISVQDSKHYGLKCVELVKNYMKSFEALEPLLYSLKNLLKNANLNDPYTGGLSSYGLILMLVSFLQNQNEHGKSTSITKESNVGRLFLEFCYYYGVVFDHSKYVINAEPINGSDNYQEKENINNIYVRKSI